MFWSLLQETSHCFKQCSETWNSTEWNVLLGSSQCEDSAIWFRVRKLVKKTPKYPGWSRSKKLTLWNLLKMWVSNCGICNPLHGARLGGRKNVTHSHYQEEAFCLHALVSLHPNHIIITQPEHTVQSSWRTQGRAQYLRLPQGPVCCIEKYIPIHFPFSLFSFLWALEFVCLFYILAARDPDISLLLVSLFFFLYNLTSQIQNAGELTSLVMVLCIASYYWSAIPHWNAVKEPRTKNFRCLKLWAFQLGWKVPLITSSTEAFNIV